MRKKRVKEIWKLVRENDPNLLLSVRNYYGEKTKDMDEQSIFREAKKLWNRGIPARKLWGIL